jgi:transcriptional regulatory protein GAL4
MSSYLTSVERRLHRLEKLFARLLPEVDVDQALSSSSVSTAANTETLRDPTTTSTAQTKSDVQRQNSLSEALPDEADGFEWKEEETADVAELTDGMASLSVEPAGIGYLGMCCLPNPT